ncbi:FAD-binding monooxygenase [Prauserella marina]|uniref:2-polyprenyl-6-methoxyphenol hydroxylase n=1 Tax=Prauserella marina TaxID=530584 RepID=A0A222VQK4_9PSEU|nr:FAD-dependent monooxygenase [Prauserella marina]ASR36216.1 FAD-binding monooxygenase [Prauserella marina]PWV76975.1 2-polyprenyl-6-methoxyphenol hydroxylase-like FAD-dependent oxidoreductase [Prauserella marina]SDD01499.1 2-polyprenyl-6-methoxyphenol hydroxylase [Prauserella marina]
MRVVVVGGGIGGLALGAGLRRKGFDAVVFDRDTDVAATGGYHITLDERAQSALRELVDPVIMRRLLASGSALRLRERDAFWDRRGRLLGHGPDLGGSGSVDVDRITLRTLLAEAAGDGLCLGTEVAGVGHDDHGAPQVFFSERAPVSADLVVGADGTHSIVARHLAGGPTNRPAGIAGFCGRTLVRDLGPGERRRLRPRSGLAIGPRGAALYVGFLDPVGNPMLDAPELRMSVTTEPTYIWGAVFPESAGTDALRDLCGGELREALIGRFLRRGWAEHALEIIAKADPRSVAGFRFNAASTRAADLAPWSAGNITALGDAVHATPPTAGMGAGAAIRDAADLLTRVGSVTEGDMTLIEAVGRFEAGMRVRGGEVLTLAMKTVRWILATDTRLGATATAVSTPILAAAARLRR